MAACTRSSEQGAPPSVAEADSTGSATDGVAPTPKRVALEVGKVVERTISPGQSHDFDLHLEAGDFFEFEVEQRGIDVELSLFDLEGEVTLVADLPIADLGPESLIAVADREGSYQIRVKAWESEDPGGSYLATLVARRKADGEDELRSGAAFAFYQGEAATWARKYRDAIESYSRSREMWQGAGDLFWHAVTLEREGYALSQLGELEEATRLHEQAGRILAGLSEPRLAAINANHLAEVYLRRGKLSRAIEQHTAALSLRQQTGDRRGEGMTLSTLGRIHGLRGDSQLALDRYEQALKLLDRTEDRRYRATVLHDLGTLYRRLGKHQAAAERFKAAERIYAELGDARRQAASLSRVGQLVFESGEPKRALGILHAALELCRQHGAWRGEIATLRRIGTVLLTQGDADGARQRFTEALEMLAGTENPRDEAGVLADLGVLSNRLGRGEEALEYHRRSRALFEQVGDPFRQAEGLLGEAASHRQVGQPEAALQPAARALEISEALRVKPFSEDLRLSFFTTAQPFFDFNIDLLMELDGVAPGRGYAAAALQVSERARARSLLDLLGEAGAQIRGDAAPELLEQEQEVQYRLNSNVALLESESHSGRRRAAAAQEVRRDAARLDSIRAELRRTSSRYAALTQPRPLSAAEIRRLLDPDTALLEFRLGQERSYLWLITREGLDSFELPPGDEIESNAREAHLLLKQARRQSAGRAQALLCELSRQLLQPAAGRLDRKRLAIVADGALEYLPFAALPDPGTSRGCLEAEPLVLAHEVVHLPSASTLAVQRREVENRKTPVGLVAVLADPVFSTDDPRLKDSPPSRVVSGAPAATRSDGQGSETESFPRLPYSRDEAMAILNLVPSEHSYGALGFDASKQVVLSGTLAGYRIVHFATHGALNAEQPALSRIVLSQVDRRGMPLEGSLRAHEIYNLKLPADLVVLSGCQTALGKEVRGEGLVGLARGFMYAGATRVMVSLWKVSDQGTAKLMEVFYRGLLQEGLAPAAALRRAQLEVRATRSQPFYWAGFVLQGDWR